MNKNSSKVFISYSHDGPEHEERVLDLADRLREDGIDAEVDLYLQSPPEGWPAWCERQIENADFVLMVCTETYHRRVRGEEEPGKGLGVVWEAAIIRQLLYDAGAVSTKFVPLLFPMPRLSTSRRRSRAGPAMSSTARRATKAFIAA
jgi:hypothetical protein